MSLHEYQVSRDLVRRDPPFYALIMAAMAKADTVNIELLKSAWPSVWVEARARYDAPGGRLDYDNAQPRPVKNTPTEGEK